FVYLSFSAVLLLLASSRPHLHLLSFPTRRSSDLAALCSASRMRLRFLSTLPARGATCAAGSPPPSSTFLSTLPARGATSHPHAYDRKSTRLNSSHVSISYAVFCLKNKNKLYKTLS